MGEETGITGSCLISPLLKITLLVHDLYLIVFLPFI